MNKVYIVQEDEEFNAKVRGVFETHAEAKALCNKLNNNSYKWFKILRCTIGKARK